MKKTKQLLRSALAVLLVAAVLTAPAMAAASGLEHFTKTKTYAGQFSDVSADSWFYENVAAVYELSLMQGESDTYFNANGNLSIAETIAMAARLHSIYTTGE